MVHVAFEEKIISDWWLWEKSRPAK